MCPVLRPICGSILRLPGYPPGQIRGTLRDPVWAPDSVLGAPGRRSPKTTPSGCPSGPNCGPQLAFDRRKRLATHGLRHCFVFCPLCAAVRGGGGRAFYAGPGLARSEVRPSRQGVGTIWQCWADRGMLAVTEYRASKGIASSAYRAGKGKHDWSPASPIAL